MQDVKELIHEMLIENTGTHMLDSGGDSGRQWQRNQGKTLAQFEAEDECAIDVSVWIDRAGEEHLEIERTVSVFHYLAGEGSNLELDEICEAFNTLNTNANDHNADFEGYGVSPEAWDSLGDHCVNVKRTWNTYNGESDLSQTLQGSYLTIDDEAYVIVQIHGGADVRGGYTDAKLFKFSDNYESVNEHLFDYEEKDYILECIQSGDVEYTATAEAEELLQSLKAEA